MSGFCIQLGLFPIFAESNYYLVTYSFLTNFLVLFFFSYFVIFSILVSVLSFFLPDMAGFLLNFIDIFLEGVRFVTKINEMLPFYKIRIPHNPWWWYAIYYACIFFSFYILTHPLKKKFLYVICLWILYILGMYGFHHQGKLHVAVLDVGQGDGTLIKQEGGVNLLMDGGSSSKKELGKYILIPAMDYYGMEQIDYAFLSHLDTDHVSGVLELLEMGKIKKVVISSYTAEYDLKESECSKYLTDENTIIVEKGMEFCLDDLEIKILGPEKNRKYKDRNEASMVIELSYHGKKLLFTGDISEEAESILSDVSKEIDLLKVAHHGSKYSTSEGFLDRIHPFNAVISCGKNRYGHPSMEVLERLRKRGVKVHNTKEDGAMVFKIP